VTIKRAMSREPAKSELLENRDWIRTERRLINMKYKIIFNINIIKLEHPKH
jgi:hypothetical protein